VQEFRPAGVIEEDTALARSLQSGDRVALTQLVERYGGPVTGLATHLTGSVSLGRALARDVFVAAWGSCDELEPGGEFAPWLRSKTLRLASESQGSRLDIDGDDLAVAWAIASATSNLPLDRHDAMRLFYVDGIVSDDRASDVARDRNKIERRLGHLDASQVAVALADSDSWVRPDPNLADRVLESVAGEGPLRALTIGPHDSDGDSGVQAQPASASGGHRSARAALFGFGAAFAVLFGGIAVLSAFSGTREQAAFTTDLIPTGVVAEAGGGTVAVTERDTGIEIQLDAPTLPRSSSGSFYEGVLVLETGEEVTVGTFSAGTDVTLWGGVPLHRVTAFRVILGEVGRDQRPDVSGSAVVLKADFPRR
jgi:DNA-directed RNA polymerase specialized sigma24 family protein